MHDIEELDPENYGHPERKLKKDKTVRANKAPITKEGVTESEDLDEVKAKPYVKNYHDQEGNHIGYKSSDGYKVKYWRKTEGGLSKAKKHAKLANITEEKESLDENLKDDISKLPLEKFKDKYGKTKQAMLASLEDDEKPVIRNKVIDESAPSKEDLEREKKEKARDNHYIKSNIKMFKKDPLGFQKGIKEEVLSQAEKIKKLNDKTKRQKKNNEKKLNKMRNFSETIEHLEEISKTTLGSYIKKASGIEDHKRKIGKTSASIKDTEKYLNDPNNGPYGDNHNEKVFDKISFKYRNRNKGISKAIDKLTKESYDEGEGSSIHFFLQAIQEDYSIDEDKLNDLLELFESIDEEAKIHMIESLSDEDTLNELLKIAEELKNETY